MGLKLQNAPVYFTLAQVRFNPILSLETYIHSTLQESLRQAGYPDFKKNVSAAFNITAVEGVAPQLSPPQSETLYSFATMGGESGFVIGPTQITYQVAEYDVYETFAESFFKGVELLHRAVNLNYVERIGIRYLDAVCPRDGETVEQYLRHEMLGLSGRWTDKLAYSFSESRKQMESVSIVSRVVIQTGRVGMPPDLNPMGIRVARRFLDPEGRHAILDTDAFSEERVAFDLANVQKRLADLRLEIKATFDYVTTDHAKSVWK